MGKLLLHALYGAFALVALTVTSCGKVEDVTVDGPVDNTVYNEFTIAGKTYKTTEGSMIYYGDVNEQISSVELSIYANDGSVVSVLMAVPAANDRLVKHVYEYSGVEKTEDVVPFVFGGDSEVYDAEPDEYVDIVGGTIEVVSITGSGDGAVYTIAFDCELDGGETLKGIYRGKLLWQDDGFVSEGEGELDVDGQKYPATGGNTQFYGRYHNNSTNNVSLHFFNDDSSTGLWICIDMLIPVDEMRLPAHTYSYSDVASEDAVAYTFGNWVDYSFVSTDGGYNTTLITGGTIEVSVSGAGMSAIYTINVDCILEGDLPFTGTYTGTLDWE